MSLKPAPSPLRIVELKRREARAICLEEPITHPRWGTSFMRYYLPHYMRSREGRMIKPARWHAEFWQDLARVALTPGQEARLAPRGYAKALDLDTPIPTPDGWTTMADIRSGDAVYDEHGHETIVMATSPVFHGRDCFEVCFSDGERIVCDADHLWTIADKETRTTWRSAFGWMPPATWASWRTAGDSRGLYHGAKTMTTTQMLARLTVGQSRPEHNYGVPTAAIWGQEMLLPVGPYTLGIWLGDGHTAAARVTCSTVDAPIVMAGISAEAYSPRQETATPMNWSIRGASPGLRPLFGEKRIPGVYLRASFDQRVALVRGLMDSDGHANRRTGACEFTTILPGLCDDVAALLRTLGQIVSVSKSRATLHGKDCGPCWKIAWSPTFVPFSLPRKIEPCQASIAKANSRRSVRFIVAINPVESRPTRCISVASESGLFLAGEHFVPTHNSTLLSAFLIAVLAKRVKHFPWLVQDTGPQARQTMEAIMTELDTNTLLQRDFPHLRPALDSHNRYVANRDDDVVFESGQRLQAFGSGQKVRGRKARQYRPDLALVDDLENDTHVSTQFQRDKLDGWVNRALLGALGEEASVVMVGTLLHHDSVLARKLKAWPSKRYEAVSDVGDFSTSTWPEWWPAERLEEWQRRMGPRAFAQEFLHQPIDTESQMIRSDLFRYRETRQRLLEARSPVSAQVRIAVDPAFSERTLADYSAVATVARVEWKSEYDVVGVWRGRVSGDKLLERVVAEAALWAPYKPVVLVEKVSAQVWLLQRLQELGLLVQGVTPTKDKVARAEPLAILYENGQVWHDPSLRDGDYELEATQFPASAHDDAVDAVGYGIEDLRTGSVEVGLAVGDLPQHPWEQSR